jgi:Tfp pilus assembly protein PilZ
MSPSKRRDTRYSIPFPAQLSYGHRVWALLTADVSYGGVFLCTDTPPPLLQLVRVQLVLPVGDRALQVHGMTVHVVQPDNLRGRVPGIGVQFYALDPDTREAWDHFIRYVEKNCPKAPDQAPLRLPRGSTPEPLRRKFQKHTAVLKVAPRSLDALGELYTQDISTGSMFVETKLDLPVGTKVVVHITHPHNGQPFLLEAAVLHREGQPREGLGVELVGVGRTLREEFLEFVRGGINIGSEVVVDDDEPDSMNWDDEDPAD